MTCMSKLLDQVNSPEDLKCLSTAELPSLAEEIRQFILQTVSRTGGHLASNLGVVELTLALHYAFDFARDSLLWDVGHQCYTHKIITGRKEEFSRLRRADGVSGFPNPAESEYDCFTVGHAGTAIATAIGLALGRQQLQQPEKIVAVVGDGSIVNGVSFEGLNNLGLVKRQLLIVLNDNSMAIDLTQGAVAKYFSRVRLSQTYGDLRRTTHRIVEHLPVVGKEVEQAIERVKKSIRMVFADSQLFESMNIAYFGPVDGHDVGALVKLFTELGKLDQPVVLHVYTRKGRGYAPAEANRTRFHSTGPFKLNSEATASDRSAKATSFTDVFGRELVRLAEADNRIVAITSAMGGGTGLSEFRRRFGNRFYDVGIAEEAAVDIAAGLARSGCKPVVCIYATFLQRAFDQIFQEVALQNLPVVFCVDRAGLVGADGPTHHGLMDIGFLRMMPNMVLTAPACGVEMAGALEFALAQSGPVVIRYPRDAVPDERLGADVLSACSRPFELGKGVVIRHYEQSLAAVVSYGATLTAALRAAEALDEEGLEVDVINARFASPLDESIISLPELGRAVVTTEDHRQACGFGSAVLEKNSEASAGGIAGPICVLGAAKEFVRHDRRESQLIRAGIGADTIISKLRQVLGVIGQRT